jgi:asparagine synthetase B (glutamine-hydrolysing)
VTICLHLAGDVPLAVFLSGGNDSSSVANLAQRPLTAQSTRLRLRSRRNNFNEGPAARRIADAIGTQPNEVLVTESDFMSGLEAALDGLNSYFMSLAIRQTGFTVALVGTGGDELFGGYTSFRNLSPTATLEPDGSPGSRATLSCRRRCRLHAGPYRRKFDMPRAQTWCVAGTIFLGSTSSPTRWRTLNAITHHEIRVVLTAWDAGDSGGVRGPVSIDPHRAPPRPRRREARRWCHRRLLFRIRKRSFLASSNTSASSA